MELETEKDEKAEKALNASCVFSRKGKEDQWKKYFSQEDILSCKKKLFLSRINMKLEELS